MLSDDDRRFPRVREGADDGGSFFTTAAVTRPPVALLALPTPGGADEDEPLVPVGGRVVSLSLPFFFF